MNIFIFFSIIFKRLVNNGLQAENIAAYRTIIQRLVVSYYI